MIELTAPIRKRYRPEEAPVPMRCAIYDTGQMIEVSVNEHAYENGIMYLDRITHYGLTVFDFDSDSGSMTYRSDLGGVFENAALCDEALRRALMVGAMPDTRFLRQRYLDCVSDTFIGFESVIFFGLDHRHVMMLAYAAKSDRYIVDVIDTVTKQRCDTVVLRTLEDVERYLGNDTKIQNYVRS